MIPVKRVSSCASCSVGKFAPHYTRYIVSVHLPANCKYLTFWTAVELVILTSKTNFQTYQKEELGMKKNANVLGHA